jgi:hypothetical protein
MGKEVWFTALLVSAFLISSTAVFAAFGHDATDVRYGSFAAGNYSFPQHLSIGTTAMDNWNPGYTAVRIGATNYHVAATYGGSSFLAYNNYLNPAGQWIQMANGTSSSIIVQDGGWTLYTGADVGAGNPITTTAKMIINGSGYVGIGTTTPNGKLVVADTSWPAGEHTYLNNGAEGLLINSFGDSANNYLATVDFVAQRSSSAVSGGTQMKFWTQPRSTGNPAVAMMINRDGNVGIGIASASGIKLYTLTNTANDIAIYGRQTATTGTNYAGIFQADGAGSTTNVGGYFAASGATNNYGLVVASGNVGIGTTSPGGQLEVETSASSNGYAALLDSRKTDYGGQMLRMITPASGAGFSFLAAYSADSDVEFHLRGDGIAFADGSWNGGGADYAEWFEKEGIIADGGLIGLDVVTGKARAWQTGDPFIGVQSLNPGFVGNNINGAETNETAMRVTHVLVALVGQVEIVGNTVIEQNRKVSTTDGQFIGWRLANGKVYIN